MLKIIHKNNKQGTFVTFVICIANHQSTGWLRGFSTASLRLRFHRMERTTLPLSILIIELSLLVIVSGSGK